MLDIYGKDEEDNLSAAERRTLSKLVDELKRQALAALHRSSRKKRDHKKRKPLFERLKYGLEEGIENVQGELTLRSVNVPEELPEIDGATLAALRAQSAMSQAVFAKLLNVSTKTLQSWEQGVRQPSDASRRLIQVFSEQPEMFCRMVGLPAISLHGVQTEQTPSGRRKVVIVKARPKKRPSETKMPKDAQHNNVSDSVRRPKLGI